MQANENETTKFPQRTNQQRSKRESTVFARAFSLLDTATCCRVLSRFSCLFDDACGELSDVDVFPGPPFPSIRHHLVRISFCDTCDANRSLSVQYVSLQPWSFSTARVLWFIFFTITQKGRNRSCRTASFLACLCRLNKSKSIYWQARCRPCFDRSIDPPTPAPVQ